MLKQEFLDKITAIGTCEDEAQRRELLAQLSDEASKDYDEITRLTTENQTLTTNNETLRDANMKLFLRVGDPKGEDERRKDETGVNGQETKKREFKDLFDEKGELK